MKDNIKTKNDYLNSANKVNWALAIFALVSALPGGIRLVRFIMDSQDNVIEPSNLLGVGDLIIPGSNSGFREPYVTLGILVLSVLIPVIIFLFLLLKKQNLQDGKTGRGLYWLIVLLGILGVLLGIGIIGNIYPHDPTVASNLQVGPENLSIAGISALSALIALAGIVILGNAAKAPIAYENDEDEDEDEFHVKVFDREEKTAAVTPSTPVGSTQAIEPEKNLSEAARVLPAQTKTASPDSNSAPSEELVGPKEMLQSPVTKEKQAEAKMPVPPKVIAVEPTKALETRETAHAAPIASEQPTQKPVTPVQPEKTEPANPVQPEKTEPVDIKKDRVLKRKLIAYPGDDTKVVLIVREYLLGEFVREWSEIRLKSDFVKKTKRPMA